MMGEEGTHFKVWHLVSLTTAAGLGDKTLDWMGPSCHHKHSLRGPEWCLACRHEWGESRVVQRNGAPVDADSGQLLEISKR